MQPEMVEERALRIGAVARRAGVGVETIRFYERQGLLDLPARRASGYREYPENVVARVRFVRRARDLGFSLPEISELLNLSQRSEDSCSEVAARIDHKITQVRRKAGALQAILGALEEMRDQCGSHQPDLPCPFLAALEAREDLMALTDGEAEPEA